MTTTPEDAERAAVPLPEPSEAWEFGSTAKVYDKSDLLAYGDARDELDKAKEQP